MTPINKVTIVLTEDLSDPETPALGCDISGDVDGPDGLTTLGAAAAYMVGSLSQVVKETQFVEADDVQH